MKKTLSIQLLKRFLWWVTYLCWDEPKTQKTPRHEIEQALERAQEVQE